jgi:hypothetical protein
VEAEVKTTTITLLLLALVAGPALAQRKAYLTSQYFENGNQMCKYDNGTVLNMGAKSCPSSISTR